CGLPVATVGAPPIHLDGPLRILWRARPLAVSARNKEQFRQIPALRRPFEPAECLDGIPPQPDRFARALDLHPFGDDDDRLRRVVAVALDDERQIAPNALLDDAAEILDAIRGKRRSLDADDPVGDAKPGARRHPGRAGAPWVTRPDRHHAALLHLS